MGSAACAVALPRNRQEPDVLQNPDRFSSGGGIRRGDASVPVPGGRGSGSSARVLRQPWFSLAPLISARRDQRTRRMCQSSYI